MRPPRKRVDFTRGDKVEVCSKEAGFVGSYYQATVVSRLDNGLYVVRYDTLLEDDESQPLTETLFPKELRPTPPRVARKEFSLYECVDAFDNDGWWLGQITGKRDDDGHYYVYFASTNEEIAYRASAIRVHHDWNHGDWLLPSSSSSSTN